MRSRLLRVMAVGVAVTLFNTGCMLSRVIDHAFLGITVRRPSFADRKTTGVFLLPLTFAVDAATFPLQALLIVILGDNFPFGNPTDMPTDVVGMLEHPQFKQLGDEQKAVALAELNELIRSGQLTPTTSLALLPDGHWVMVELSQDARNQLLARAQANQSAPTELAVCTP